MSSKKHFGIVEKSGSYFKVNFEDPASFQKELLNLEGKRIYITAGKVIKRRSVNQNAYFHAILSEYIAPAMGELPETCKEILKYEILRTKTEGGFYFVPSTSSLSTAEFEDFLSHCRRLASEFYNCYVPLPNEIEF